MLSTLKNEQPFIIGTDNGMESNFTEEDCTRFCDNDDDCYGYIYIASRNECFTYKYKDKDEATVNITSTELKHKGRYM